MPVVLLRALASKDYGSIARNRKAVLALGSSLSEGKSLSACSGFVLRNFRQGTKVFKCAERFFLDFGSLVESDFEKDIALFIVDCILPLTNELLLEVSGFEVCEATGKKMSEKFPDSNVIDDFFLVWDRLSIEACMELESKISQKMVYSLCDRLKKSSVNTEFHLLLGVALQEFERRLGQLRKQRAGNDLESSLKWLLKRHSLNSVGRSFNITPILELDNAIRLESGSILGFSLKRTLRERWKQIVPSREELRKHGILRIYQVVCNVDDLSATKVSEIGERGGVVVVPDSLFSNYLSTGSENHIIPSSELIPDIKRHLI